MTREAEFSDCKIAGAFVETKSDVQLENVVALLEQLVVWNDSHFLVKKGEIGGHKCDWFTNSFWRVGTRRNVRVGARSGTGLCIFTCSGAREQTEPDPVEYGRC